MVEIFTKIFAAKPGLMMPDSSTRDSNHTLFGKVLDVPANVYNVGYADGDGVQAKFFFLLG